MCIDVHVCLFVDIVAFYPVNKRFALDTRMDIGVQS
jgi:hypothetical protein